MGSFTFGYFFTSLGSKRALLFLTIPDILFWTLIYFGNSFYYILIAKFLGGWAASGAHGGAILFVAEIASDEYVSLQVKIQKENNKQNSMNNLTKKHLYINKIDYSSIRGRLGTMPLILRNIGTLLGFVLGATLTYNAIPLICVCIPIVFGIVFIMIPNTPRFYLQRGHIHVSDKFFFLKVCSLIIIISTRLFTFSIIILK